jgi:glycosyltransferase involved in cell wall biosynthesis
MAVKDYAPWRRVAEKSPRHFLRLLRRSLARNKAIPQEVLNSLALTVIQTHPSSRVLRFLPRLVQTVAAERGLQSAWNLVASLEVALHHRKPTIGLYDNAAHYIGGAQKYGCTIASALQDDFDITLIANRPVARSQLENWYGLDLSRCRVKVIPIPYFEKKDRLRELIDAGEVDTSQENPFHLISLESGHYDLFINNCMLEMVYPLANVSIFITHFPERGKSRFFYVKKYSQIVANSLYTARWIRQKWDLNPHQHLYPPVDMEAPFVPQEKENIILSVSRFDPGGNKQQLKMIEVFQHISRDQPEKLKGWRLAVVGGSIRDNPYLGKINGHLSRNPSSAIELRTNLPASDLKSLYQKAKIFWHFCGLGQTDPAKVEHFGMTVAEAMQNGCVPIAFRGGGQMEIVEDTVSGFLFSTEKELAEKTLDLIGRPGFLGEIGKQALERGKRFRRGVFVDAVQAYVRDLVRAGFSVSFES